MKSECGAHVQSSVGGTATAETFSPKWQLWQSSQQEVSLHPQKRVLRAPLLHFFCNDVSS